MLTRLNTGCHRKLHPWLTVLVTIVMCCFPAYASARIITGLVHDQDEEPVIGATVRVEGTDVVTVTNIDGAFSINAETGQTLVVSYVGCVTAHKKVSAGTENLTFLLEPDSELLDEVVVVGYGEVKKADLTGSVANIRGDRVTDRHTQQLSTALQGQMAGVQVSRTGGAPGASASQILIRGVTTIGDTSPLVIVDGVPIDNINDVNASDVESISVLKDAASAAIYGSRAASGVILITTRRASDDSSLRLNYNFEYGWQIPTSQPKQVKFQRYLEMVNELRYNDNPSGGWFQEYSEDDVANWVTNNATDPDNYPMTDWYDLMVKDSAPRQSHVLNLSGGTKKVKTRVTLSYDREEGLFKEAKNTYDRFMVRSNNDFNFNKYISASADINVRYSENDKPTYSSVWSAIFNYSPAWAATYENGGMGDVKGGTNPYGRLTRGGNTKNIGTKVNGKFALNIMPVDGLKLQGVFSPGLAITKKKAWTKAVPFNSPEDPDAILGYMQDFQTNNLTETRSDATSYTFQAIANYVKTFNKVHNVNAMVGYENYYYKHETLEASGDHFVYDTYPYMSSANKDYLSTTGTAYENAYRSFFGRLMYNYDGRYLIQANIRHDGSSRFHKDHRWGTFPSVSLGWVISKERFMKNVSPQALTFLKLRGSWGRLGNERIGNYPYISLISPTSTIFYESETATTPTFYPGSAQIQYAIQDITWETTESFDLGFDAKFLNDRLSVGFDWYRKNTKDMLLELEIPKYVGYSNPEQNAGKMHTTGYDIELAWRDNIGELFYSVSLNLSDYTSKMGDLKGTEFSGDQISRVGSYYNEWYGYVADGLFQTAEEVAASATLNANTKPGDIKFKDISGPDGVPDGIISPEYDRVLLGNSLPRYLYGGNITLAWRGFDVAMAFQGVGSQKVRKTSTMVQPLKSQWGSIPGIIDGHYWSENNTEAQNLKADYPRLTWTNQASNNAMSSFWIFNGRYFRMKNLTLGYTLPQAVTRKAYIEKLRVYAAANDLFCIHGYPKGYDPERTTSAYPLTTSILVGFNVQF